MQTIIDDKTELLQEILEWYKKQSAPNGQYSYHRCPICAASWWGKGSSGLFGIERHNLDCWVPRLHEAAQQ